MLGVAAGDGAGEGEGGGGLALELASWSSSSHPHPPSHHIHPFMDKLGTGEPGAGEHSLQWIDRT